MRFRFAVSASLAALIAGAAGHAEVERPAAVVQATDNPVSVTLRGFVGFNDNTQYFNDFLDPPVDQEAVSTGASAELGWNAPVSGPWQFGAGLRLDSLQYSGDESAPDFESPSDYSFYVIDASAFATRSFDLAGRDAEVTANLRYRFEDAPGVDGVGSTTVGASVDMTTELFGFWDLAVSAEVMTQDFDTGFAAVDPQSVRDGTYWGMGATLSHPIPTLFVTQGRVGANLEAYDADGENWSYDGFSVHAGIDLLLAPRLSGTLDVSYASRSFSGDFTSLGYIAAPGRDDQTVTGANLNLSYLLRPGHTLDLGVSREIQDSPDPQFTGDRTTVTVGYTWVLQ